MSSLALAAARSVAAPDFPAHPATLPSLSSFGHDTW